MLELIFWLWVIALIISTAIIAVETFHVIVDLIDGVFFGVSIEMFKELVEKIVYWIILIFLWYITWEGIILRL